MTEAELLSLLNEYSALCDANFGFWLTASFSVVVAVFFAGEQLEGRFRSILVGLYLASAGLFYVRFMLNGANHNQILDRLNEMGSTVSILTTTGNNAFGVVYTVIMFIGTIATTLFVVRINRGGGT